MNAVRISDTDLALLHRDVRAGHSSIVTFEGANGTAWLDVMGPLGMRPDGDFLRAEVPTLRLWGPGPATAPRAIAAASSAFDRHLRVIEDTAGPLLFRDEAALLSDVLAVVLAAVKAGPKRLPGPGPRLTVTGAPSLHGWASCLPLGDLQAVLRKAVA